MNFRGATAMLVSAMFAVACMRSDAEAGKNDDGYGQTRDAVLELINRASEKGRSLSGVQVNEYEVFIQCTSLERTHELTGKWPAVLGLELMFIIENPAYRGFFMKRAKEHAARGGLVALTWHARNPLEVCPRGEYYKCSQHPMTDAALARLLDPSTHEHALWAKDVDAIADVLKELEAAGVAVIFRPYHEMNGGWFWWGQKQRYVDLWRALHKRLTEKHGLREMAWTWSSDKESVDVARYYPGDAFVDVVGADLYSRDRSGPMYETAKTNVSELRPSDVFAFTEIGLLPSPEIFTAIKPAWFLLWGGEFMDARWSAEPCDLCNKAEDVAAIYALDAVLTLDEIAWPKQVDDNIDKRARAAPPPVSCPTSLIEEQQE
ncbi:MAG: glycosyl hydrolase [Amphiplicatus sp.]